MFVLSCNETVQMCYNMKKILVIVKTLISVIQWSVPALLILMGTIDMFKAVTKADDGKVTQDAIKSFIRRLIAGVIVFLVPFIVRLILNFVDQNMLSNEEVSSTSWVSCWNNVDKKNTTYFNGCKDIYNRDTSSDSKKDSSTKTDEGSVNSCSGYSCPSDAKFLGIAKKLELVTYNSNCYCRASIPSSTSESISNCRDIIGAGTFAFSQTDSNSGNDYCYFNVSSKNSSDSNNSSSNNDNNCTTPCNKGTYKNGVCSLKKTKPTDELPENNNCKYACGNDSIFYDETSIGGIDICECHYKPNC